MIPEILEAIMLICFGFSWPMSVIKNIKAKTAKSMSLPFILLILSGYIAGIAGKFISGNISYVLIVYIINILSVGTNLIVYFINKGHDRAMANKTPVKVSGGN
ncbi:MAG: hypothetical protein J1F36_00315 [Clostridiales bacterium]|nr:hypothetical protein [Clostridiales bacterium]